MSSDEVRDVVSAALALVIVLAFLGAALCWLPLYRYADCRKVGHSVGYCLLDS